MTANLLAHGRLFRAGAARSGAYNRTLTPFGFQNEQRTFWEVPQIYEKMSPFFFAHKIEDPILLIHGEADNNSGTFPIQSERFYMALKGNGRPCATSRCRSSRTATRRASRTCTCSTSGSPGSTST